MYSSESNLSVKLTMENQESLSRRFFITGIAASGKSYLCNKVAGDVGGPCVSIDDVREELKSDAQYEP